MTGGLMQLLAYGFQDIDFFKTKSIETIESIEWQVNKITFEIPINAICPISLEVLQKQNGLCKCLECKNVFGYYAYKKWIEIWNNCPLCRTKNIEHNYYTLNGDVIEI